MSLTLPDRSLLARYHPNLARGLWIAFWVALFLAMHTPPSRLPKVHFAFLNTAVHLAGYTLLALLGGACAQRSGVSIRFHWCVKWFVVYALYAAVDECTQPLVRRIADFSDWLIDMVGVTIALTFVYFTSRRQ